MPEHTHRLASGLVRTLVVATATLAILLVCFSIYQYSQVEHDAALLPSQRLPSPRTEPNGFRTSRSEGDPAGVKISEGGVIGAGEKTKITIYPSEGREARFEVEVRDWTPVKGTSNEFLLSEPDIRMRTEDDHAVRVTAKRGRLEAQRKGGGGIDPQRGTLSGDVVIQYDRLTLAQRRALPLEQRDKIDPDDLVVIRTDEIEFDLEFSKVVVPGALQISARDVDFQAANVEVRFNPGTKGRSRVEYLRIASGGRLELKADAEGLGVSIPGAGDSRPREMTVAEWIRASIQSRLAEAEAEAAPESAEAEPAEPKMVVAEDGTPIFRPDAGGEPADAGPPVRYAARFEGEVHAQQFQGDGELARLLADRLEVVRELSGEERARTRATASGTTEAAESGEPEPGTAPERIVLRWEKRVVVEACDGDDGEWPGCAADTRSQIRAIGSPVRLAHPEVTAECGTMTYVPDRNGLTLAGDANHPVVVDSPAQGRLTAARVVTEQTGDRIDVYAEGPGRLERGVDIDGTAMGDSLGLPGDGRDGSGSAEIAFGGEMHAAATVARQIEITSGARISTTRERLLERARFTGQVDMVHEDTNLEADALDVDFAAVRRHLFSRTSVIDHVRAVGHVVMTRREDRITCDQLDVDMRAGEDGRVVLESATARGNVTARQKERFIEARDRLTVDFGLVERPVAPETTARAMRPEGMTGAVDEGTSVATVEKSSPRMRTETIVRRLAAEGDVRVSDPAESLDVSGASLDCMLSEDERIDTARILGGPGGSAAVRLDTFTVTGGEVQLNVPEESAEVPGAGRLSLMSRRDLDGCELDEPIPISIAWREKMAYCGIEKRAVFTGQVHATSATDTTFDAERLEVEFDEVAETAPAPRSAQRGVSLNDAMVFWPVLPPVTPVVGSGWWLTGGRLPAWARRDADGGEPITERLSKKPAYILATGNAVALTSEVDPQTGDLRSRVRLAGPKLSVNLRPEVSKLLIEGPGSLLLEDLSVPEADAGVPRPPGGLFGVEEDGGPSNTLIEWTNSMWYDFSLEKTRFEGDTVLKHFSGAELQRIRGLAISGSVELPPGRATFLSCQELTIDFQDRSASEGSRADRRMGRLSAGRLQRFQASRDVRLQDRSEGLFLDADTIVFWKERDLLAIYGTGRQKAHVVMQRRGQLPLQLSVERAFYNLATGEIELHRPDAFGQ